LEESWRALRSDFYQGLIIYASAFVHAQRGNPTGVRKQLAKVQRRLPPYRPHYLGIDVDEVLATTAHLLALVEAEPQLAGEDLRRWPRDGRDAGGRGPWTNFSRDAAARVACGAAPVGRARSPLAGPLESFPSPSCGHGGLRAS